MSNENNSSGFFGSLKEVCRSKIQLSNTLLSADGFRTIDEPELIIHSWKEYFDSLLNVESNTENDAIVHLPLQNDITNEPTVEEVVGAIKT